MEYLFSALKDSMIGQSKMVISPQHPDEIQTLTPNPRNIILPIGANRMREEVRGIEATINDIASKLPARTDIMLGGALGAIVHAGEVYRIPKEIELVVRDRALSSLVATAHNAHYHLMTRPIDMHIGGGSKLDIYLPTTPERVLEELAEIKKEGLRERRVKNRNLRLVLTDVRGKIPPHTSLASYWDLDVFYETTLDYSGGKEQIYVFPDSKLSLWIKQLYACPYATAGGLLYVASSEYILAKKNLKKKLTDFADSEALRQANNPMRAVISSARFENIIPKPIKKKHSDHLYTFL